MTVIPHITVVRAIERVTGNSASSNGSVICPAQGDETPICSIDQRADERALLRCYAGCEVSVEKMGIKMKGTLPHLRNSSSSRISVETAYDYRGEDGTLLYQVVPIGRDILRDHEVAITRERSK